MKYNPYGELRATFGADAVWEDIKRPFELVLTKDDLRAAEESKPEDVESPCTLGECVVAQGFLRVFGDGTTKAVFPRVLYLHVPGEYTADGSPRVRRGEFSKNVTKTIIEPFDAGTLTEDSLPIVLSVNPPVGDRSLAARRKYAAAHKKNKKAGETRDHRKHPTQPRPKGMRFRRDGVTIIDPDNLAA